MGPCMRITIKQLEIFVAIAKTGNLSKAAETVFLTQPACSMALNNLENQLGDILFERRGKKLILNEIGKKLFPKAINILSDLTELQTMAKNINQNILTGQLTLGASTTIGNYILPKIIGHFVKKNPLIKINLPIANTETIIQALLRYTIDLGIIEGDCYHEQIDVIPWKTDQLIIIASPKHAINKIKKITPDDLVNADWVLREIGSGTRKKFENAMPGIITPRLELGHTEAVKQAVIEGIGISCLSRATVLTSLKKRELIEIKAPFLKLTREFSIIRHKKKRHSKLSDTFYDFISI